MATAELDLRAKLARQDAALQAMAQHLEKFKDFELESSVKVTEELAQAMEMQSQLKLRNESLVRTIENQAHTIELLLLKRSQLLGELEEAQQHSNHLRSEFDEQLGIRESAYAVLNTQFHETKGELDATLMNVNRLESEIRSNIEIHLAEKLKLEEQLLSCKQELSGRLEALRSSYEAELIQARHDLTSCKSAHLDEINSIRQLHDSQAISAESQFRARIARLESENEDLRSKVLEAVASVNNRKSMEDNLTSQLQACHNTIRHLQCQLGLCVTKLEEKTNLEEEISSVGNDSISHFCSINISVENEIAKLRESTMLIKDCNSDQINELQTCNQWLLRIIGEYCDRNTELKADIATLHSTIAKIEERDDKNNDKQKELLKDCDSYKATINFLRNQLCCDHDKLSNQNSLLEEQLTTVKKEYENRLLSLESYEKELVQMKDILEITKVSHVEELSFLQRQFDSRMESVHGGLSKRIADLESENEKLRSMNSSDDLLHLEGSGNKTSVDCIMSENEELRATINRLENQLNSEQVKFSEEKLAMQEHLTLLEKESLERFDSMRSYESQLSQLQKSARTSEDSFCDRIAQVQQEYECRIESLEEQFRERIVEVESDNERLSSQIAQYEQMTSNEPRRKQNEQQLVSELETSLLECEQLYIVNTALKAAQNQAVEDARRFQARIKELSAELGQKKGLEDSTRLLRSKLETTALRVQKLCSAVSTIPAMLESCLQAIEAKVSAKIASLSDRLDKKSAQIIDVQQAVHWMLSQSKHRNHLLKDVCKNAVLNQLQTAMEMFESSVAEKLSSFSARLNHVSEDVKEIGDTIEMMQSQFELDLNEFEKSRQGEQAGYQRVVDCSQATIEELLSSRVHLEQHVANLGRELEDVHRQFDHAQACLSRELMAQSTVHSLFESLQFQTMHLLSSLQHDVDGLTHLFRHRGKLIHDLELCVQNLLLKLYSRSEDHQSSHHNRVIVIQNRDPNQCRHADHVPARDIVRKLKSIRHLSEMYHEYNPSRYYEIFEEISRIVINETAELKVRHELVVNSLLKQLANGTDSSYYENRASSGTSALTTSFREILSIIESECYPPGRFSYELKQLSNLFQQAQSIQSSERDTPSLCEPTTALADSALLQGLFCDQCTKPIHLPIYCDACSNVLHGLESLEQSQALQQVAKARHELQDEVSQLRSCLNKAAAAITELEIRLQEASIEKSRLLDDFERANKEKQAYVTLLQESVNEIHSLEESERDLRSAHRTVDEELHRSKVLLIGEGRAKQIFSRRVRMLQDTLSLTRVELQQYKLDCARLDTLNKKYLADLESIRESLSSQSIQNSPKMLQGQVAQLENDLSTVQLQLADAQQRLSSYESELKKTRLQNALLKRTLGEVKSTVERGLRGFLLLIPQAKAFVVDYIQGEARALSNHCQSLLRLISLDRHAVHHLQARLAELSEKDLLQSQALARAGRQLKEFQIVLSAQSTQIQSLKHQLRRSEADIHDFSGPTGNSQIAFKRLTSERDLS